MIKVNVWKPNAVYIGYVSAQIEVSDESSSVYISWWPERDHGKPIAE